MHAPREIEGWTADFRRWRPAGQIRRMRPIPGSIRDRIPEATDPRIDSQSDSGGDPRSGSSRNRASDATRSRAWSYLPKMRAVIAAVLGALAAFGLVTWVALEGGGGVAVLETKAPNGTARATRVWVAEQDGSLWLEAPNPRRAWLHDVSLDPIVSLARDGRRLAYRAVPEPGEDGHRRIRAWLRERYGWRDAFVGLLADTSQSIAVRLEPIAPPAAGE
jgi:hypothetical protein